MEAARQPGIFHQRPRPPKRSRSESSSTTPSCQTRQRRPSLLSSLPLRLCVSISPHRDRRSIARPESCGPRRSFGIPKGGRGIHHSAFRIHHSSFRHPRHGGRDARRARRPPPPKRASSRGTFLPLLSLVGAGVPPAPSPTPRPRSSTRQARPSWIQVPAPVIRETPRLPPRPCVPTSTIGIIVED